MASGIYSIRNKDTGMIYIGSTNDFNRRWWTHRKQLNTNTHGNYRLQRSWNVHGEDAFEFAIIEEVADIRSLLEVEQYYIDVFYGPCSYNILRLAGGGFNSEDQKLYWKQKFQEMTPAEMYMYQRKKATEFNGVNIDPEYIDLVLMLKEHFPNAENSWIAKIAGGDAAKVKNIITNYSRLVVMTSDKLNDVRLQSLKERQDNRAAKVGMNIQGRPNVFVDHENAIKDLTEQGLSLRKIADQLNIGYVTVRNAQIALGIHKPREASTTR